MNREIKISMGIWGNTNLRDRFNPNGFKEDVSVQDRIKEIGSIKGIKGIELHYPTEIDDDNYKDIEKVLNDNDMSIVQLCGHTWVDKDFKFGALGHPDGIVRKKAVKRVKEALDMADHFKVPISVLWPACTGSDFPLQSNYIRMYDDYLSSVRTLLDYIHRNEYVTKLALEPKPFEPRSYILAGTTAQALTLVNEIGDDSFGINYDIGHSLIAKENPEDQLALICRYRKLFHTHFNDNDQQCDADLPPGTVGILRLVKSLFILDETHYSGWHGLDLFPYRDEAAKYMRMSRNNLEAGYAVVDVLKEKGVSSLQKDCEKGPEISQLVLETLMSGDAYHRARDKYTDEEWRVC